MIVAYTMRSGRIDPHTRLVVVVSPWKRVLGEEEGDVCDRQAWRHHPRGIPVTDVMPG